MNGPSVQPNGTNDPFTPPQRARTDDSPLPSIPAAAPRAPAAGFRVNGPSVQSLGTNGPFTPPEPSPTSGAAAQADMGERTVRPIWLGERSVHFGALEQRAAAG
ncbi:hypothetical protein GCM10027271_56710 [Saccharopolyspora gloriosae]